MNTDLDSPLDHVIELIGTLWDSDLFFYIKIMFVAIFLLACGLFAANELSKYGCEAYNSYGGLRYRFDSLVTGCMVEVKPNVWIPIRNWRWMEQ